MKRIVVLGGMGFFVSVIVDRLRQAGLPAIAASRASSASRIALQKSSMDGSGTRASCQACRTRAARGACRLSRRARISKPDG